MSSPFSQILGLSLLTLLVFPNISEAQSSSRRWSNEGGSEWSGEEAERFSEWRRQSRQVRERVEDLDDDIVEEIPIPVLGISLASITPDFGDPRGGGTREHEGQDILAPLGTPVLSPTEAVVLRIGEGSSSGKNVYTANPGGETFVYMHLDDYAPDLEEGDRLEAGDLIGYVGNTGNASGGPTHLHFEIREGRDAKDPYPRLTGLFTVEEVARSGEYVDTYLENIPVRDLELGMTGEDVRALQRLLNGAGFLVASSGSGSPGLETDYFGSLTQSALARYQATGAITPSAGYFGPITRAHMKAKKLASLWW